MGKRRKGEATFVRSVSNDRDIHIRRSKAQTDVYFNSMMKMVKKVQKTSDEKTQQLLYNMFLPLLKSLVKKYRERFEHNGYECEDLINEVAVMFFNLIHEYKPQYGSSRFFMFYIKFMIEKRMQGLLKDIYKNAYKTYDNLDAIDSSHYDKVDEKIFMDYFWEKVDEQIGDIPHGKQFVERFFFSDEAKVSIKDLNDELDANCYTVYQHIKERMKLYFNQGAQYEAESK